MSWRRSCTEHSYSVMGLEPSKPPCRQKGNDGAVDKFPPEVIERLKWYVYRLVDPRSGETFYVGKGKGDRVFQHAKGALSASDDEDATDLKSQRIKDIGAAGLEVAHVIHRHGIESEDCCLSNRRRGARRLPRPNKPSGRARLRRLRCSACCGDYRGIYGGAVRGAGAADPD